MLKALTRPAPRRSSQLSPAQKIQFRVSRALAAWTWIDCTIRCSQSDLSHRARQGHGQAGGQDQGQAGPGQFARMLHECSCPGRAAAHLSVVITELHRRPCEGHRQPCTANLLTMYSVLCHYLAAQCTDPRGDSNCSN